MMNAITLTKIALLGVVIILAACNNDNDNNNTVPVANAGPDQTTNILVGDVVLLDGGNSSDADGDTLSYLWSFVSVPPDSMVVFSDSTSDAPSFEADKAGTYVARLIVSDGGRSSTPDEVTIIVVAPAPTVTITTPEPLSLFTANPVTVEGTVDDPLATITVNSIETSNNSGSYSADIDLAEGSNTVTVIATNSTGQGEDSITVMLKTQPGPVMSITSHRPGFTEGLVFNGCPPSEPASIPTQVHGTITTQNGPPTVDVNGVTATVTELAANPLLVEFCNKFPNASICNTLDNTRYSFSVALELDAGERTITATGFDTAGRSTTVAVSGVADYCYIAEEGVPLSCPSAGNDPAVRGNNQSKRCHAIDGCSAYIFDNGPAVILDLRNNPMPLAQFNRVPIEFGDGEVPPEEFFVHGQDPARKLGCNMHDVCYQTCVPVGQRDDAWEKCDLLMLDINQDKCREAYPATCPYTIEVLGATIPDPVKCPLWLAEKSKCFSFAQAYRAGLSLESTGGKAFDERQGQYCQ
jgi:hypothetical protein